MPQLAGENGNKLLTNDVIVKEALVQLKNQLVLVPLVKKSLEKEFGTVGKTVNIPLPPRVKTASGRVMVKQPLVKKTKAVTVNHHEHFAIGVTLTDRALSIGQFAEDNLKSGTGQIAQKMDASIALQLKKAWHSSGTPGQDFAVDALIDAGADQDNLAVPAAMRRAVLNPKTGARISKDIKEKANEKMVSDAIREGYIDKIGGYETYKTQNVFVHKVGDYAGTPQIRGASQSGKTLITDGWDANIIGLLNAGDVITIDGVYELNPASYESTGRLRHHVVMKMVSSDGAGIAIIELGDEINDGTLFDTNLEGDQVSTKAYQNVTAGPADNATITVLGDAGKRYEQSYLFHRDAVMFAGIDLELPDDAPKAAKVRDEQTGLSMTMTGNFDIYELESVSRIDAVWLADLTYGDVAMRGWGLEVPG